MGGGNTNRSSSNSSSSNSSSSVAGGGSPAGKGKEGDDAYAMAGEDVSATDVIMRMGNENFESQVSYDPHIGRGVQYCRFFRNMLADTCPIAVSQMAGQFFMEEDFEQALLKEDQCPFSRAPANNVVDYGHL